MGSGMDAPPEPPGRRMTEGLSTSLVARMAGRHARCCLARMGQAPRALLLGANGWSPRALYCKSCLGSLMSGKDIDNESDQADRTISTSKLRTLLPFHTWPINVVVFHGSQGRTCFEVGFPLRCLQRLSRPHIATLH